MYKDAVPSDELIVPRRKFRLLGTSTRLQRSVVTLTVPVLHRTCAILYSRIHRTACSFWIVRLIGVNNTTFSYSLTRVTRVLLAIFMMRRRGNLKSPRVYNFYSARNNFKAPPHFWPHACFLHSQPTRTGEQSA